MVPPNNTQERKRARSRVWLGQWEQSRSSARPPALCRRLLEEGNEVGALLGLLQAGKHHLVACAAGQGQGVRGCRRRGVRGTATRLGHGLGLVCTHKGARRAPLIIHTQVQRRRQPQLRQAVSAHDWG